MTDPAAAPRLVTVDPGDDGIRLDRWCKRHLPDLSHGLLQKLLRQGRLRLDGQKAEAGTRVAAGQVLSLPAEALAPAPATRPGADEEQRSGEGSGDPVSTRDVAALDPAEAQALAARVLYRDDRLLVIDKPAGLAVQGGSGIASHLDGMLDALRFGADERPRLVHRLDKDTSGALVLARSAASAAALAEAFRRHGRAGGVAKHYRAITVGVPSAEAGLIDQPIAKRGPVGREKMVADPEGQSARTRFRVLDRTGDAAALVELEPLTGRTHQLRAHCAIIGCPILGDGKYGGAAARLDLAEEGRNLKLHAHRIALPALAGGPAVTITCPPPKGFLSALSSLGLEWLGDRGMQ